MKDRIYTSGFWHKICRTSGASEKEAAENLKKGLHAPYSGLYSAYSMSDGAAMRISPIGIICAGDLESAAKLAKTDAEVSHSAEGVWAAQAVAVAVAAAMVDASDTEIMEEAGSFLAVKCISGQPEVGGLKEINNFSINYRLN